MKSLNLVLCVLVFGLSACSASDEGAQEVSTEIGEISEDPILRCFSLKNQESCEADESCSWGYQAETWSIGEGCPAAVTLCIPTDLNCAQTLTAGADADGNCWLAGSFCGLPIHAGTTGASCIEEVEWTRLSDDCGRPQQNYGIEQPSMD